ncbi:MAG: hypothetical protein WBW69_18080 [Candidatus Korobacteraceae bacterium]
MAKPDVRELRRFQKNLSAPNGSQELLAALMLRAPESRVLGEQLFVGTTN